MFYRLLNYTRENKKVNTTDTSAHNYRRVGQDLWKFIVSELKPKGKLLTPFNIVSAPIILLGLILIIYRFTKGLGASTNLSQEFPWGIWIGFDVVTGVAFAAGAYIVTFMVYVLRMEKYHSIVRATVLNGFLAYVFYAGALTLDLGRPWKIVNPIIGNSFGVSSVLFLVAWHFLLYMMAQFFEGYELVFTVNAPAAVKEHNLGDLSSNGRSVTYAIPILDLSTLTEETVLTVRW